MNATFRDDTLHPIQAILENVPSMLAYWDDALICRFANNAYERWFGVPGASLIGTALPDLLGAELFALNEPHIRAALRGEPQEFERLVPGPGGVRRPSQACYIPHVVNGKTVGFVAQVTEVTKLHDARTALAREAEACARANALLRQTQAALQLAQHLGEMGSWEWDIDEDIMQWTPQLYEIFGLDPQLPAPSFAEQEALYSTASRSVIQEAVQRATLFGMPYAVELEYRHRSGRRGFLEARGTVERDAAGRVVRLRGTAQEVSARRIALASFDQHDRISALERRLADEQKKNAELEAALLDTTPAHLLEARLRGIAKGE